MCFLNLLLVPICIRNRPFGFGQQCHFVGICLRQNKFRHKFAIGPLGLCSFNILTIRLAMDGGESVLGDCFPMRFGAVAFVLG